MEDKLKIALDNKLWKDHEVSDYYTMDNKPDKWRIAYYPIFEDNKTKEVYNEPRALIERPIPNGIDFREVPLRYLTKLRNNEKITNTFNNIYIM